MGIKELWTLITPYCERKPIYELQGKVVAIDLAGWVCESLNVVDYFVHPKQYLKNLFFRTCYLLLAGVIPVFVLEGKAPELKQDTITKRNALQFRGNKPREEPSQGDNLPGQASKKGRTRFNYVLKECEKLLETMGLRCIQAPGEAEAFCAHLNINGQVYGIISQDSDCFAYGAIRVFRNFSVSTQGKSAAAGGSIDIYDMEKISNAMDFGQNKIIAMALLCGCDYCPGVEGVGRDGIIKLFKRYKESDILKRMLKLKTTRSRIRSWRAKNHTYNELEVRVDDKNICANCGHHGKTFVHGKVGCSQCKTHSGCDWSLWREERLAIKAELLIRKKALMQEDFPSEKIINEFLTRIEYSEKLDLKWRQPNLVRFVKAIGNSLQWTEIYCFQKFLPLLTRWLIYNYGENCLEQPNRGVLRPDFIKKKRTPKGIPSYEIVWKDEGNFFEGLIPDDQLQSYTNENPKGSESLFSSIEPIDLTEKAFPTVVQEFLMKQKKSVTDKKKKVSKAQVIKVSANDSLHNMDGLLKAVVEAEKVDKKRKKKGKENLAKIDKFLIHKSTPIQSKNIGSTFSSMCSTPKATRMLCLSDLEDDNDDFNYSEIIKEVVSKNSNLKSYAGKHLRYDSVHYLNRSQDDLDLVVKAKRNFPYESPLKSAKRLMLSGKNDSLAKLNFSQDDLSIGQNKSVENVVDRFLIREGNVSAVKKKRQLVNVSYFFETSMAGVDEFERSLDLTMKEDEEESSTLSTDE